MMDQISRITSSRASSRPITSRPMTSARPLTSTGLMAPKTSRGRSGIRRQVQDKSYFMGLLRTKINELNAEIQRLTNESNAMAMEESRIAVYQRKAEELAKELASLTNELAIYNEYNDRLRTGEDENEIKEDIESLKHENEEYTKILESNYEKKKRCEQLIRNDENELEQIQNTWKNLRRQFSAEQRERFDSLEKNNMELSSECEKLEIQINAWRERRNQIEINTNNNDSLIRREILQAVSRFRDLEKQRDELVSESNSGGDEWGRLLAQVKRDNKEIATMETRINTINEQIQEIRNELETYEDVGAAEKYKELKKKEETIEQFLKEFEGNKKEEMQKMQVCGAEINEISAKLSRCLSHIEALRGNGSSEGPKENDNNNSGKNSLQDERRKLELDFNKIQQLETKINSELDSLRNKIKTLEDDIETYSDIPKLKAQIEQKLENLLAEKQHLNETNGEMIANNEELKLQLNALQTSLDNNEINKKIKLLENNLNDVLGTNESVKEIVKNSTNINIKAQVLEDVKKYNQKLLGF